MFYFILFTHFISYSYNLETGVRYSWNKKKKTSCDGHYIIWLQ